MLTFSDPCDFNQLKLGLCGLPKPLREHACTLSLKLPQFSGRHCFGKDPWCSPYLLQVINPSSSHSLAWLHLLVQHPRRGEPSFGVPLGARAHAFEQCFSMFLFLTHALEPKLPHFTFCSWHQKDMGLFPLSKCRKWQHWMVLKLHKPSWRFCYDLTLKLRITAWKVLPLSQFF